MKIVDVSSFTASQLAPPPFASGPTSDASEIEALHTAEVSITHQSLKCHLMDRPWYFLVTRKRLFDLHY